MYQNPQYGASPPSSVDLAALYRDIDDLIVDAKIDCASHPMDQAARTKLSSLQSLKNIVEMGKLSEKDLQDVRVSVSEQMAQRAMPPRPTPPPVSTPVPMSSTPLPYSVPMAIPQAPPSSTTPSFINSNSLAELIRATANHNQPTPPPPLPSLPFQPQLTNTPPANNVTPAPPAAENPLIAQLRASGLLPATPTPPLGLPTQSTTPNMSTTTSHLNVQNRFMQSDFIDVQFTSASIRMPRPQLVTSLFSARPNACNTCGRRFTSDDVGKEQKAKHLDWHFKTKSRMADAEKKGQSRSWYVDEREWISSKEYVDGTGPEEGSGDGSGLLSPSSAGKSKMPEFVRAPNDPHLKSLPCPIDLEPFVSFWSDELQEFIWTDAIQVGDRIYHASCYRQAMADRAKAATPVGAGGSVRVSTPDSVLGKRKAEVCGFTNLSL
jgi:pre-mRNA cleavage complex 2 protein Pcf11